MTYDPKNDGPQINPEVLRVLKGEAPAPTPRVEPVPPQAEETQPGMPGGASSIDEEVPPSLKEIVDLGAKDSQFFCKTWFPKTFRIAPADFHPKMWELFDDPTKRYINIMVTRDGAKTTMARACAAKRIAYGISRTILYIGASQAKATQSAMWLKRRVAKDDRGREQTDFAKAFGLRRGKKWGDDEFEIIHGVEDHSAWVIALGVTGSVRGINFDDYRPDLIIVDDCMHDQNSATPDQRLKIENLVLGAVKESLSPRSETPDAKLIILNTPQDFEDFSVKTLKDPQFHSARFGCWTPETEDLAFEDHKSSWEVRYPTEELKAEKAAAIARNKYSTWAREKEVKLVTPETSSFRPEWIQFFGDGEDEPMPPIHEMWIEMAIDPVPPPTAIQIAKGLKDKDYEAFVVAGRWRAKYYILETVYNRGHNPGWTVSTFFDLCNRWRPQKIIVEAVAYQAVLAWLLRQAMIKVNRFYMIEEFKDKRDKLFRINQGLSDIASNNRLYMQRGQTTLVSQFVHYPGKNPGGTFDDVLEAAAVVCTSLSKGVVGDALDTQYRFDEENIPELEDYRGAP